MDELKYLRLGENFYKSFVHTVKVKNRKDSIKPRQTTHFPSPFFFPTKSTFTPNQNHSDLIYDPKFDPLIMLRNSALGKFGPSEQRFIPSISDLLLRRS